MTIVWTVLEVMFVFCFFELPRVQEPSEEETPPVNEGEETHVSGYGAVNSAVNNGNLGDSGTGRSLNESEWEESGPNQPLLRGRTPGNISQWKKMHVMSGKHYSTVERVMTMINTEDRNTETLAPPFGHSV